MPQELPKYIDPQRLAERAETLSGVVAAGRLHRIGHPYAAAGPVAVKLDVSSEDTPRLRLTGRVRTELKATCQRCLGDMAVTIDKRVDVILIDSADPSSLVAPEDDVLTITDGKINIDQFVEDEVILGCPMIPLHDTPECRATSEVLDASRGDRKKPFAGLSEMMAGAKKNEALKK